MAITYQSGSSVAGENFKAAVVSDTVLTGAGSFAEETTDLLANGYKAVQLFSDTTNYIGYFIKKTWN